jgi:hypothetical protein
MVKIYTEDWHFFRSFLLGARGLFHKLFSWICHFTESIVVRLHRREFISEFSWVFCLSSEKFLLYCRKKRLSVFRPWSLHKTSTGITITVLSTTTPLELESPLIRVSAPLHPTRDVLTKSFLFSYLKVLHLL